MLTDDQRAQTLARYLRHRAAWDGNEALRTLYQAWYAKVAARLPDPGLGPFVEIGSGPGFARSFLPHVRLSDVVRAPWHDYQFSADRLPFADGRLGALILFDVLHHLASPAAFFAEATRALAPGGRVVMCEPYLSALSFPVYRWLHEEPVVLGVDPLADRSAGGGDGRRWREKDPFDSNQAIPTLLFHQRKGRQAFAERFPDLRVLSVERFVGLSYPSSGGFGRAPFLPLRIWRALSALERGLPGWVFRLIGFRIMVVLERRGLR